MTSNGNSRTTLDTTFIVIRIWHLKIIKLRSLFRNARKKIVKRFKISRIHFEDLKFPHCYPYCKRLCLITVSCRELFTWRTLLPSLLILPLSFCSTFCSKLICDDYCPNFKCKILSDQHSMPVALNLDYHIIDIESDFSLQPYRLTPTPTPPENHSVRLNF